MTIPCKVGSVLLKLNAKESKILQSLLDDKSWSGQRIAVVMKKTPNPIGATTIKIHLRKECGCFE